MFSNKITRYDDIIHLPHHQSTTHPHMSMMDRAAQFSPFAALTGFEEEIAEEARLTDNLVQLTENSLEDIELSYRKLLHFLEEGKKVLVHLTWFRPDDQKEGGAYLDYSGVVRRIDPYEKIIYFSDGVRINMDSLTKLECEEQ